VSRGEGLAHLVEFFLDVPGGVEGGDRRGPFGVGVTHFVKPGRRPKGGGRGARKEVALCAGFGQRKKGIEGIQPQSPIKFQQNGGKTVFENGRGKINRKRGNPGFKREFPA